MKTQKWTYFLLSDQLNCKWKYHHQDTPCNLLYKKSISTRNENTWFWKNSDDLWVDHRINVILVIIIQNTCKSLGHWRIVGHLQWQAWWTWNFCWLSFAFYYWCPLVPTWCARALVPVFSTGCSTAIPRPFPYCDLSSSHGWSNKVFFTFIGLQQINNIIIKISFWII